MLKKRDCAVKLDYDKASGTVSDLAFHIETKIKQYFFLSIQKITLIFALTNNNKTVIQYGKGI